MRLVMEPIQVVEEQDEPRRLRWRSQEFRVVRVLDRWTWRGRWWRDPSLRGEARSYVLVDCERATLELFRSAEGWVLSRLAD